ncbi:MAG: cytochrome c3 family protein [Coriobacteriia bacterium]|nr:cytochrome c3 family protein [Coriobacteriia bacterium]
MRFRPRTALLAFVLLATLLVVPVTTSGQPPGEIDVTAQVTSQHCMTCHARLGESDLPNLIFAHGAHLLVPCEACHARVVHESGVTYLPTMQSCFVCHGLEHGPQGLLATGDCVSCHPPAVELRPVSHAKDWAEEPHAKATDVAGTNPCLMCHAPQEDCDPCHRKESVEVEAVFPVYLRIVPDPPEVPPVVIDTGDTPSMGSCVFCHPEIDKKGDPELIFTHDAHLKRDYECGVCHERFPHRQGTTARPTMVSCYRCHSLEHAEQGEVAPEDCEACHPKDFELRPADHTLRFAVGGHKDDAPERPTECTSCHESSFCSECHVGGQEMANGQTSQPIIPADHRKPEWQPGHGGEFLGQRGACSICHETEYCLKCHVTPMPHSTEWLVGHGENGYPTEDCQVCHRDRGDCQDCHHQGLIQAELVKENCVDCHEEVDVEDPTTIKNIPLAEHAVHFNVEESKGRPYICEDCHIGFTATSVFQPALATQVHDLRVCYDCHGNLDLNNVIIAPYPGKELCYRCHKDLNL